VAVWINGTLVPDDEAQISVFDHGLVTGDGVFETVKVVNGVPFALSRHLARLSRSAAGLGLAAPDLDQIKIGVMAVIVSSGKLELARMRITVTGGIAPLGSERGGSPLTAIVALAEAKARPGSTW
jgi:branched-chain amino acid aminotransferase